MIRQGILDLFADEMDNPLVQDIIVKMEVFKQAQQKLQDYEFGYLTRARRQRAAKMKHELKKLAEQVAEALQRYTDDNIIN